MIRTILFDDMVGPLERKITKYVNSNLIEIIEWMLDSFSVGMNVNIINYYNGLSVYNSNRCIFSSNSNFLLIEKMLRDNPNVFDLPKCSVSYGGKEYFPK